MLTLYHWSLTAVRDFIRAGGYVTGHPKLDNGIFIHTSPVKEVWLVDGVLRLTTCSGNQYTLLPETIAPEARDKTVKSLRLFQIDTSLAARGIQARLAADARRLAEAEQTLTPGQLLLEVVGTSVIRALFWTEEGLLPVEPLLHAGTFSEDSILVADWKGGKVDFRYFPRKDLMKPYHISDGLVEIVINNLGATDVAFGQEGAAQRCPAGELTVLRAADHSDEWLFSPDAVNGKCLSRISLKEEHNNVEQDKE